MDFIKDLHACFLVFMFWPGLGCVPFAQASAPAGCPPEMNSRAGDLLVDARRDWFALSKHQKIFASCDDGELGEGYSDAVANLFAERWDLFGTFVTLAKTDPAFQGWAIRHIDASASGENLDKIVLNSNTCVDDPSLEKLCKMIRQKAADALVGSARSRQ
jgi:hypothetical protein